ncbi:hypothetical protein [Kitasatospora sp. NPDC002040]|uniref:hypothetical protein n=1 Tax=Kitasatospora sp. NPDC002040 TaxID=3154661 RepID=UPI00331F6614
MTDVAIPSQLHRAEFMRLSGLLVPAELAADMLVTWDANESGLAVEELVNYMSDHHTPLLRADRAVVLELADAVDVSERAVPALRWCPDLESEDVWWHEIEGMPRASAVAGELAKEIAPGHILHGSLLTPWLECGACDDVLVRLDDEIARTGRTPYQVAVVHLGWSRQAETPPWPTTFVFDQVLDALDRLESCFRGTAVTEAPRI